MVATHSRYVAVATGALLLAAGTAGADEAARGATPDPSLPSVAAPPPQRGWLRSQLAHLHLHKKSGLAYTRRLDRGERDYVVSVRGPALGHKRLGLSLELRF